MTDVLRAHFREFAAALTQLSSAHTQSDRLRAQKRIKACTNDMARNKESVSTVVRLLEALPAKTRATKQDLAAYKQLEARLERMTQEKAEADKMIAALRESLAAEQAAHTATKQQYRAQLALANKHILAIKTQVLQIDRVMQELVAALVKRNHKGAAKLLHDDKAEAIKQKIVKAEKHMAVIRQTLALAEQSTGSPVTLPIAAPVAASLARPLTVQRRAINLRTSVSGKMFGPAKQQAEEFVALAQKYMLVGDECVRWLVTDNPLFDMSRRAKYLRAVARTPDTGAVLANAYHFSMLVQAGAVAAQMRLHHVAALQALLRGGNEHDIVADNLAAARELYALVRDTAEGLSEKHAYQFCFEHEVQASNTMLGFLHTQAKRHLQAQASIVRYVAMSDPETPLVHEFLTEDEMVDHRGISVHGLSEATQLTVQDLEPLQACVRIVQGYRDMQVPADAKPLWHEPLSEGSDDEVLAGHETTVRLAKRMIDEIAVRRPDWARKYRVGVQLLMASVTLDKFAEVPETLYLLTYRDTVSYEMAELLAAASTPEQVAGMLTPHAAALPAFDLASYLHGIESSPPAPPQSLWPFSRAELRARVLQNEDVSFVPDARLVDLLRSSELSGAQAYIAAITQHTQAIEAFAADDDALDTVARAFVFCAPDVGPGASGGASGGAGGGNLTRVAARESPMARAAVLTAALLKDDEMNIPVVDVRAARRTVQQLAQLNPESLVKVLQNTPNVQTLVDKLGPSVTRDTVAAFLRAHATPLRSPPDQSMVWFRSDACMAEGDCGDPTAALTQNMADGFGALTRVLNVLQVVAYATKAHLPDDVMRRAKAAHRFPGVQWLCETTKQLASVVTAPLTDSLRLQIIRTQQFTRQQMTAQRLETTQLRLHMAKLHSMYSDVIQRLREAKTNADRLADQLVAANRNLLSTTETVTACHAQLRNLQQHIDGSRNNMDRAYVHTLMAAIAKQKYIGAVQLLELASDGDQRQTLQRTVDELAYELRTVESQPTAEQYELQNLKQYLEKELAYMQAQATELVNEVARVKAEVAGARAEVAALTNAQAQCASQMSGAEQQLVANLNNHTQLVAGSTTVATDEERAHLLQELHELRDQVDTINERERRQVAELDDARRVLQELEAQRAQDRAAYEARLTTEAAEREALQAQLAEQLASSAQRMAELRAQTVDEGSRSRVSQADAQIAAAATMLHRVSDALLDEMAKLQPLADALKVDTTELVTKATTVKNARIASDFDAMQQSENIARALKLFGQLPQAVADAVRDAAANDLAAYDAAHSQRVADLQQEIKQLEAKVGVEKERAARYNDIEQYLLQRSEEESLLAAETHYAYNSLNGIGRQALSALDRVRDPENTPEEVAAAKKDLSAAIVAYQARYQAVLDTISDSVRQHFDHAIANYERSLARDAGNNSDAWRAEPMTEAKLPLVNAEARLMLSMQAAWRRARLQRSAGMQDMQEFIKFILTSLERVASDSAAQVKYYQELVAETVLAHSVGDVTSHERQLATLLVAIEQSAATRDQWADVEKLRELADQRLAALHQQQQASDDDLRAVRIAFVSAAARAAAAGGVVAEAYKLQATIAEMRHRDFQRQQLQVQLDQLQAQRTAAETELARVREVMQQREVEQQVALEELKAEHEATLTANRAAATVLTEQLQQSTRALNDATAADLYLKAKHRVQAVQLLRDGHMQDFQPARHAGYMADAGIAEALGLIDKARDAVRQAFVPTSAQLSSALDTMAEWLVQVQAQDAAIAAMLEQQTKDDTKDDGKDYLDALASVQTTAKVAPLILPTIKDLDDVPEEAKVVHLFAAQLTRLQTTIMAQRASLAAQIAQIADMSAVEERDQQHIRTLEAQLAELRTVTQQRVDDAESKRKAAESRLDVLMKERVALEVQLRTAESTGDVRESMRKLETELTTLRTLRDTYQATLDQNAQLRQRLDELQSQHTQSDADREQELDRLRKRRTEIGMQHSSTQDRLAALRLQLSMAESQLHAGFTEQQDALVSRDAALLDKYRNSLSAWLNEEMQLIDTEIAERTAQQAMSAAEREQLRKQLFDKLALDAETKINEYAESMEAARQADMDELVRQRDAELAALHADHARQAEDLEQQLHILDSLATTLNIDASEPQANRHAHIELAVRELQHTLATERLAHRQERQAHSDRAQQLIDAQKELQQTQTAMQVYQESRNAQRSRVLDELQQRYRELESELATTSSQLRARTEENKRQALELARCQTQIQELRTQLADAQAEVDEQVGINSELRTQIQSLQADRESLLLQVAQLTDQQQARDAEHAEELEKLASTAFSHHQQQQFMDLYRDLEQANSSLEARNQRLEADARVMQTCDNDTYNYLQRSYIDGSGLTGQFYNKANLPEVGKNVCWLAKQVAFYDQTSLFDRYWPMLRTAAANRVVAWKGLRKLFVDKGIIPATPAEPPQACSTYKTPMDCMRYNDKCYFDDRNSCVELAS
jgi:hypothetical protein